MSSHPAFSGSPAILSAAIFEISVTPFLSGKLAGFLSPSTDTLPAGIDGADCDGIN